MVGRPCRDGVARLKKEGTVHKRLNAHVGSVNVTGGHSKEVEDLGGPAMGMGLPHLSSAFGQD
jgi:hypothetical protein